MQRTLPFFLFLPRVKSVRTPYIILALAQFSLSLLGCSGQTTTDTSQQFEVIVSASTDEGKPVAGVRVTASGAILGTTAESGTLSVKLRGTEGQTLSISALCPVGYNTPPTLPTLRLAHTYRVTSEGKLPTSYEIMCTRQKRDVVLVIHAPGGAQLPIRIDDKPAAVIGTDGNAQLLLSLERNVKALNVTIDSSAFPQLKPSSPSRLLSLHEGDTILFFEQTFQTPPKRGYRAATVKHHIPYRID